MMNRRDFLKTSAAGTAFLAVPPAFGFWKRHAEIAFSGKSRVVLAEDSVVRDDFQELIPTRVDALLDRAVIAYTGKQRRGEAWRAILGNARTVGIKVDGRAGKRIATHALLVNGIVERLQHAGVRADHIIIWDATAADLKACGFSVNTEPGSVQCYGSDVAGYEDQAESWGSAQVRISKILTRHCDMVIDVPVLKDDRNAGVAFAMENMFGAIDRPQVLEAEGCCPVLADLNCIPTIRKKMRFTVGDALSGIYDGGPAFHYNRLWYPNSLIVGRDRVAVDQIAWQMIDRRRAQAGLKSLAEAGRSPRYLAVAADASHALGTDNLDKIELAQL